MARNIVTKNHNGRAMAQAVSRRPPTAEARVRSRVSPCRICGGQSGTGTGFSPSTSVFPCQFHSTGAPLLGKGKKNYNDCDCIREIRSRAIICFQHCREFVVAQNLMPVECKQLRYDSSVHSVHTYIKSKHKRWSHMIG
jgi:hypothetical protein